MSEPNAPRVRFHSLDALRGVAMILGVVIHASNAYRTDFSYIWAVQDPSRSIIADAIGHVIHAFRMPLFFLLSGFFSRMVYQRVGYREFLRKRWNRVAVPLLLGVFTLTPLSGAVDEFAERRAGPPKIDIFNPVVWKNRDTVKSAPGPVAEPPAYFDVLSRAPWPLSLLRHTALG
jgi:fucose 4-O-acetylase-like acetyltransferase